MRASKPVLVTVSALGGLVVFGGTIVLPPFVGFVLAVAIAMLWCWWLERHRSLDESTFGVWSYPLEISTLRQDQEEM